MVKKKLAIAVALMVILAGGITSMSFVDDDFKRDPDDLPDAIPGGRYDPRF